MTRQDAPAPPRPWPADPLRIVAIGGGTGLSSLLHGLKPHARALAHGEPPGHHGYLPAVDLTAVVTVTDDGGSSGRLRRDFDVLPPGDIRNCLVALSEDEALLSRLFRYRFARGRGLKGHSFGNLFLAALAHITGDFPRAVQFSAEVLAIVGRIYPSTTANVTLEARLEDGTKTLGETRISRSRARIETIALKPRRCLPLGETLEAIARADLITLGPGSLFTSVIPNLLVEGIPQAIRESPALKAYFVNLMWQPGETSGFSAADHVAAIHKHAGAKLLDYVIMNARPISASLRRKYARLRALPVENDFHRLARMGLNLISRDLLQESHRVRHDPAATAQVVLELAREARRRRRPHSLTATA
jgi:uncharacterized cofD-like protein